MKNIRLRSMLLTPLLLFTLRYSALTTLPELSKPYTGVYRSESIMMGDKDLLDDFEYVTLELLPSGIFKLEFKDLKGVKGLYRGHYTYNVDDNSLTINETLFGKKVEKTFFVDHGVISIPVQFGETLLFVKFKLT